MKRFNWQILAGFLLSLFALISYPFVFVMWPVTRDFPWANLLMFAVAMLLLFVGIWRAFKPDRRLFSKVFSSLAALIGVLSLALFVFSFFVVGRWLPPSSGAPQVGQKAPDFALTDSDSKPVSLAELLTQPINNQPPKGVLLIFYRGYW